jgi:hypothetical protein
LPRTTAKRIPPTTLFAFDFILVNTIGTGVFLGFGKIGDLPPTTGTDCDERNLRLDDDMENCCGSSICQL